MPFIFASKSKRKVQLWSYAGHGHAPSPLSFVTHTQIQMCSQCSMHTHTCRRNNIRLLVDKWLNLPDRPVSEGNKREGWSRDGRGRDGRGGEGERT